jgi:hypothetical protein
MIKIRMRGAELLLGITRTWITDCAGHGKWSDSELFTSPGSGGPLERGPIGYDHGQEFVPGLHKGFCTLVLKLGGQTFHAIGIDLTGGDPFAPNVPDIAAAVAR